MRALWCALCLLSMGCSWTEGVTGAFYLRLDAVSGILLIALLPCVCHVLLGRSWGRQGA